MEAVRTYEPCCCMTANCEPLCCETPTPRRTKTFFYLAVALVATVAASVALLAKVPVTVANAVQTMPAAALAVTEQPSLQSDLGALNILEAERFLASADTVVKVDVSAPQAYVEGHLKDAVTVPVSLLTQSGTIQLLSALPEGFPVLVYASDASDAASVYALLKEQRTDIPAVAYVEGAVDPAVFVN